ncbi:MAG: diphosphomevalonate decarboxylase [Chloroflexi bacterium]|nr:diphosphomevalonate decarboxylase [Chloroflexota bacterium]
MHSLSATAEAHPNIAFIKYWGNRDNLLRLPTSGSISMNLGGLTTRTRVIINSSLEADRLKLNDRIVRGEGLRRVQSFLDVVRLQARTDLHAEVITENNFPSGAGIASSASAFAALAVAAARALGLDLSDRELSCLARRGSGSASRSIPAGFVEWIAGEGDADSYAVSIASPEHWNLVDCIAMVNANRKATGSTEGHASAGTSPLQAARVADAPRRLDWCRRALLTCDFTALAEIAELDSNLMHAIMMTSIPALMYWEPPTLEIMSLVRKWRAQGDPVFYTIDAGPNVHAITTSDFAQVITSRLRAIPGVREVITASPGGGAHLSNE